MIVYVNRFSNKLLKRLVSEAESQVEHDLSERYEIPFVHMNTDEWDDLPDRPTKNIIRTLCELQGVIRVLETDYGRGTIVNGDDYADKQRARYDKMIGELLAKKGVNLGWQKPPLLDLKSAYFNDQSDDGYAGMVIHHSDLTGGNYPEGQITDPSKGWWNINDEG